MSDQPQTIIELHAQNVKRLHAVRVDAAGKPVVIIGGRNGQGKSSVLDAITMAFCGKDSIPDEPIRHGESRATILCRTQDYTIERRITPSGSTLVVTKADGSKMAGPQAVLDNLISDLAFDPLAFLRMKPKEQSKALQRLIGIDVDALAAKRQAIYNERAQANAAVKALEVRVAPLHPNVPESATNASALAARIRDAERYAAATVEAKKMVERHRAEVARLTALLDAARAACAEAEQRVAAMPPGDDVDALLVEMRTLEDTNRKVRENAEQRALAKQLDAARAKAQSLQSDLEAADEQSRAVLVSARMPIPGLTVDADHVRLHGVPLSQASQAEQIRAGVAIAMAQRPGLRVALVRDGSLLDDDSMAALAASAAEHGAQVWVERVGRGQEVSVVIEEGSVVSTDVAKAEPCAIDENPFAVPE